MEKSYMVHRITKTFSGLTGENLTKQQAIKLAKETAKKYLKSQIVVSWRYADGQRGYLNPDGNHAKTTRGWGRNNAEQFKLLKQWRMMVNDMMRTQIHKR